MVGQISIKKYLLTQLAGFAFQFRKIQTQNPRLGTYIHLASQEMFRVDVVKHHSCLASSNQFKAEIRPSLREDVVIVTSSHRIHRNSNRCVDLYKGAVSTHRHSCWALSKRSSKWPAAVGRSTLISSSMRVWGWSRERECDIGHDDDDWMTMLASDYYCYYSALGGIDSDGILNEWIN